MKKTCKDTPDDVKKKSLCNQKCPQLFFLIRKNEGKALLNVKDCRKMGWKWPHNRSIPFYIDRVRLSVIFVTVTPMTIYRKLSNLVRIAFLRIASHSEVGYYRYYLTWSKGWTRKVVSSCAAFTASTFAASQFSPATITFGDLVDGNNHLVEDFVDGDDLDDQSVHVWHFGFETFFSPKSLL